jgi:hypothetical protein
VHREEGSAFYRKIADDLAATRPEVVYDPHPGVIAGECSRQFHLIARMLPLLRHDVGALRKHRSQKRLR